MGHYAMERPFYSHSYCYAYQHPYTNKHSHKHAYLHGATHYICLQEYGITPGISGIGIFQGATADATGAAALPYGEAWQRLWMALNSRMCTSGETSIMTDVTRIRYFPP